MRPSDEGPQSVQPGALDATLDSGRSGPPPGVIVEGTEVGPFVVSRKLGAGAMGSVYAAWDARLEREVALKVLHLESDDLLREARLLAKLNHPHVVMVHEVISWNGRIVLVMEYARGRSLREWLAAEKRSPAEIIKVFAQCAGGLGAAHAAGVIHRDFKPDNALVDESGRARLLDFGLATPQVNAVSSLAGSPAYMALAQLEGAPADARSDQFSWWLSLYEALAGRRPHDGSTLQAMVESRRRETVELTPLPLWLRGAMARGLSKNAAARFPSMEAAASALRRPWRRRTAVMAVLSLFAAAGLGVFASNAATPCARPAVSPASFEGRTDVPALREAAAAYAGGLERCLSLPREEQVPRAQCLEVSGRELSLAFEVLDQLPGLPAELKPRVLRRVLPAGRCERGPPPRVSAWNELERPALLASLRAQLEFDVLRTEGKQDESLRLATEHRVAADASQVVSARAWARINEAAALSVTARIPEAVALLRQIEAFPGLGLREETWAALMRWLFECYLGDEERCRTQREHARRFSTELNEPWTLALSKEIAMRYDGVPVEEAVAAWGAIPGAGLEARRAMANELANVQNTDDLRRVERARKLAGAIANPDARTRLLILEIDALSAVRAGDLARARALVKLIEAEELADTPTGQQVRHGAQLALLGASRRYEEMLALTRPPYPEQGDPRYRYRMALMRMRVVHAMHSPELDVARAQAELIAPLLNESERLWLELMREQMALLDGDVKALQAIDVDIGGEALREWQIAVLTGDRAKQKVVLAAARNPEADDWCGRRLQIEGLLEAGKYEEAAAAAARLRAEVPSVELIGQIRLQEARALWALDRRDEACRVASSYVLWSSLLPHELARAEQFLRECPVVGVSADPG
ncbi:MAG: serine/threonine-protein kinase [Archangium sp.]|nr:serine/threonine-protein kinase [Archangium sp.]